MQPQVRAQMQPQLQANAQAFVPTHQMLNTALRDASAPMAPQMFPQQPVASSAQVDLTFVGMDMLNAVAALRSLGSETP